MICSACPAFLIFGFRRKGRAPVLGARNRRSASASALATIPAAIALTDFTANVFVLTGTPQTPAIPALILDLLNYALSSHAIARDWCG